MNERMKALRDLRKRAPRRDFRRDFNEHLFYLKIEDIDAEAFLAEAEEELHEQDDGPESTAHYTQYGSQILGQLANQAALHALRLPENSPDERIDIEVMHTKFGPELFKGILIDTGASHASSAGHKQYLAYQKLYNVNIDPNGAESNRFKFGLGATTSKGTIDVNCPIGTIKFHVVDADTPFLLSLNDLDRSGFYYNNQKDLLIDAQRSISIPVDRLGGHPFLRWDAPQEILHTAHLNGDDIDGDEDGQAIDLTEQQLRQLHRRFGHPSIEKLTKLLQRSAHDFNRETLANITKYCESCQLNARQPGRFKFTIKDDIDFNHSVYIDIFYIKEGHAKEERSLPVLHVIDEATRFQAARFIDTKKADHVWDTFKSCWIDTYLGPPDFLIVDAGKEFLGDFKRNAKTMSIQLEHAPTEAHHKIGIVERYHEPLRRAYQTIRHDLPTMSQDLVLQMAVKAINDTVGPDALVPTLLVFGAFPKMTPLDPPNPSVLERARVIRKAMTQVRETRDRQHVADALSARNGPIINAILDAQIGSRVLVWREKKGWKGPYTLLSIEGSNCILDLPSGPTAFRITSVKPFYEEEHIEEPQDDRPTVPNKPDPDQEGREPPDHSRNAVEEVPIIMSRPKRDTQPPLRYRLPQNEASTQHLTSKEISSLELSVKLRAEGVISLPNPPFVDSRNQEIKGLLEKGVFQIVNIDDIEPGTRIFTCRFVDEIKYKEGKPYEKSRLVVMAYHDQGKSSILTQSPTIQRCSQRLLLALAAMMMWTWLLCLRDVSQAYINSLSKLVRPIYVWAPDGVNLGGKLLMVIRPLYGIPEAGTHWFKTYHDHHLEKLGLTISSYDPCLLFSENAIVGLQTDDTLFCATEDYIKHEDKQLKQAGFPAKPTQILKRDQEHEITFNGAVISARDDGIYMKQPQQCKKISQVDVNGDIKTQYMKERARGAYIASLTQPEAAFALSRAAQTTEPTADSAAELNKCLKWQYDNQARGLYFPKINRDNLKLIIFVDASFANNDDMTSQIGYVILLANQVENGDMNNLKFRGSIIHWSSTKCKRVTRSVLASELYAMVAGYDIGYSLKTTIDSITGKETPLILCTDSFSLYDCITKLSTTAEKRLMIDIMSLRQSYDRREINQIIWIDGLSNPADAMTKAKPCSALKELIDTGMITVKTKAWIEREGS